MSHSYLLGLRSALCTAEQASLLNFSDMMYAAQTPTHTPMHKLSHKKLRLVVCYPDALLLFVDFQAPGHSERTNFLESAPCRVASWDFLINTVVPALLLPAIDHGESHQFDANGQTLGPGAPV